MKLLKIYWKNIGPYGNKLQTLNFSNEGGLWTIFGKNGNGKCLSSSTKITISLKDKHIEKEFLEFLKNSHFSRKPFNIYNKKCILKKLVKKLIKESLKILKKNI
jgi:hypothetical protein